MTRDQMQLDAIADAVGSIERYHADTDTIVHGDDVMNGFVFHVLANIGSNAAKLSASLRARHADIPWPEVVALQVFSTFDGARDAEALKVAVRDTLPQFSAHLFELARDAAKANAVTAEPAEPAEPKEADCDSDSNRNGTITLADIRARRPEIERIAAEYGASNVRVFGSVARGDAKPYSDIDFLVDMEPGRSLFDLGGLQMDLQELFERPVDVAHPRQGPFRDRITAEAVSL